MINQLLDQPYLGENKIPYVHTKGHDVTGLINLVWQINVCNFYGHGRFKLQSISGVPVNSLEELLRILESNIDTVEQYALQGLYSLTGAEGLPHDPNHNFFDLSVSEKAEYLGIKDYIKDRNVMRLLTVRQEDVNQF